MQETRAKQEQSKSKARAKQTQAARRRAGLYRAVQRCAGYAWLCLAVLGCAWLCLPVPGCAWLCLAMHGCAWLAFVNLKLRFPFACFSGFWHGGPFFGHFSVFFSLFFLLFFFDRFLVVLGCHFGGILEAKIDPSRAKLSSRWLLKLYFCKKVNFHENLQKPMTNQ